MSHTVYCRLVEYQGSTLLRLLYGHRYTTVKCMDLSCRICKCCNSSSGTPIEVYSNLWRLSTGIGGRLFQRKITQWLLLLFLLLSLTHPINTPTKKPLPMVTLIDVMFSIFNRCRSTLIIQIAVVFHWFVAKAKTMSTNNLTSIE